MRKNIATESPWGRRENTVKILLWNSEKLLTWGKKKKCVSWRGGISFAYISIQILIRWSRMLSSLLIQATSDAVPIFMLLVSLVIFIHFLVMMHKCATKKKSGKILDNFNVQHIRTLQLIGFIDCGLKIFLVNAETQKFKFSSFYHKKFTLFFFCSLHNSYEEKSFFFFSFHYIPQRRILLNCMNKTHTHSCKCTTYVHTKARHLFRINDYIHHRVSHSHTPDWCRKCIVSMAFCFFHCPFILFYLTVQNFYVWFIAKYIQSHTSARDTHIRYCGRLCVCRNEMNVCFLGEFSFADFVVLV